MQDKELNEIMSEIILDSDLFAGRNKDQQKQGLVYILYFCMIMASHKSSFTEKIATCKEVIDAFEKCDSLINNPEEGGEQDV